MDKKKFAKEVLGVGVKQFYHVLSGSRGLSFLKAKKASEILGGEIDLWIGAQSKGLRSYRWEQWERKQ